MRTHGWAGSPPKSDAEAVERILDAAKSEIDRVGRDIAIADVARILGVTRQTVYRYFPSTDDLIVATAIRAVTPFIAELRSHLADCHDPATIAIRSIVFVLEHLPKNVYLNIALSPSPTVSHAADMTSQLARDFALGILTDLEIDWVSAGFGPRRLAELAEHMLRLTQSLVLDPGDPPKHGRDLLEYLDRWLRPAVEALTVRGSKE